jgi:alpha-tubulin suppressor-like RCC1 family protein
MNKLKLIILFNLYFFSINAQSISAGGAHSLYICNNGDLMSWGSNSKGQLGDSSFVNRNQPVNVKGVNNIIKVSAGGGHSLALRKDSTVWAWGYNQAGQLGDGTLTNKSYPVKVLNLQKVVAISAGENHSLALTDDGSVWVWGYNRYGQLGDSTSMNRNVPVKIHSIDSIIKISAGQHNSMALRSDSSVWIWGDNNNGQLGFGSRMPMKKPYPVKVNNLEKVIDIVCGARYCLALNYEGIIKAWGKNYNGELGDGTVIDKYTPIQVSSIDNIIKIDGKNHNIAYRSDSTLWTWGRNSKGQLADSLISYSSTPIQLSYFSSILQFTIGGEHNMILKNDSTLWTWGGNSWGELGDGTNISNHIPKKLNNSCQNSTINNINYIFPDLSFSIYPNPATDYLSIQQIESNQIEIYNSFGSLIEKLDSNINFTLNLSNYPTGMYFIISNNYKIKFLKQ